jgi:uncharacterized protein
MTVISTGFVATPKGERYVQQLIKHWSHRLDISFTDGVATIPLNPAVILTLTTTAEGIAMHLSAPDDAEELRFQRVFENHLDRFAFREVPLGYSWVRESA